MCARVTTKNLLRNVFIDLYYLLLGGFKFGLCACSRIPQEFFFSRLAVTPGRQTQSLRRGIPPPRDAQFTLMKHTLMKVRLFPALKNDTR